jgi:hypothetical protein
MNLRLVSPTARKVMGLRPGRNAPPLCARPPFCPGFEGRPKGGRRLGERRVLVCEPAVLEYVDSGGFDGLRLVAAVSVIFSHAFLIANCGDGNLRLARVTG